MNLKERLILSISVGLLGALMVYLGSILEASPAASSGNSMFGIVLIFLGLLTILFGLAYALTRPVNNVPDVPARPYRINDPNRAKEYSMEARMIALQGWYDGSTDDGMPSQSPKDKEK